MPSNPDKQLNDLHDRSTTLIHYRRVLDVSERFMSHRYPNLHLNDFDNILMSIPSHLREEHDELLMHPELQWMNERLVTSTLRLWARIRERQHCEDCEDCENHEGLEDAINRLMMLEQVLGSLIDYEKAKKEFNSLLSRTPKSICIKWFEEAKCPACGTDAEFHNPRSCMGCGWKF